MCSFGWHTVIGEFADGDMRQESRRGQALVNRKGRQFGSADALTAFLAGVFDADMLADEEARGDKVELLGDGFAKGLLNLSTTGTNPFVFWESVFSPHAGQVLGEGFTSVAVGPVFLFRRIGLGDGRFGGVFPGRVLHMLAQELEEILQSGFREPFGLRPEVGAQELLQPVLQVLVLRGQFKDHLLQQYNVGGECGWIDRCHV